MFSLWGVGMLIVLAAKLDYRGVSLNEVAESQIGEDQTAMYIAAGCYGAFVAGCGARFAFLLIKSRMQARSQASLAAV